MKANFAKVSRSIHFHGNFKHCITLNVLNMLGFVNDSLFVMVFRISIMFSTFHVCTAFLYLIFNGLNFLVIEYESLLSDLLRIFCIWHGFILTNC